MSGYPSAMATEILQPGTELTAADRCDRCGAQALERHRFKAGELLFCGHHGHEYAVEIAQQEVREVPC